MQELYLYGLKKFEKIYEKVAGTMYRSFTVLFYKSMFQGNNKALFS